MNGAVRWLGYESGFWVWCVILGVKMKSPSGEGLGDLVHELVP